MSRLAPVRSALLALPLMLAADVATTALTPGASLTASAHAADFTGKIKRIKIKKRRTGSGFKVVAKTTGDSTDAAGSVETTLTPLDGGPALEVGTMDAPRAVRANYSMTAELTGAGPYTYTMSAIINGEDQTFVFEELVLDGAWVEDSTEDGGVSIRMKLASNKNGEGAEALAGALDRDHDGGILDNLGGFLSAGTMTGGSLGAASLTRVAERYVGSLDGGDVDPTGFDYAVTTTIRNADGEIVDTVSEQLTLSDAVEDDGLQTVKLRENRRGQTKVATVTNSLDGDVGALEVQVIDAATGAYILDAYDTEPVSVERWFQVGGLEFDPGESPDGYTYLMLADMIDSNGDPFGEQQEFEVSIDGLEAKTAPNGDEFPDNTVAVFGLGGEGGIGTVEREDDGTYTFFFSFAGTDAGLVADVNLIFEEPYEGPAPLETEVNLPLALEWKKWVQKGGESLPDTGVSVSVNVVSEEGVVLDRVQTSADGTGTVYKTNDGGAKGTRKYGDILIDGVPLEFD
jgi:hypothetical protein